MKSKPFVLLGVNTDGDVLTAKQAVTKNKLTWRSWYDGKAHDGPISKLYGVDHSPTFMLIDERGIVRKIFVEPKYEEIEKEVLKWVAIAEANAAKENEKVGPAQGVQRN